MTTLPGANQPAIGPDPTAVSRRPRVLVISEFADPEEVSIALTGWSHSEALAEVADTHLVTQLRGRDGILRAGLKEGGDFTALDTRPVFTWCKQAGDLTWGKLGLGYTSLTAIFTLHYYYFEHLLWRRFGRRLAAGEFDVVHRVTPPSPVMPSILARRCARLGVPFILGPLNGGLPWPKEFDAVRRREGEWLSYVREAYKLLPAYHATRKYASAIVVGSLANWEQLDERYRAKSIYVPENGLDVTRFDRQAEGPVQLPLKVVFVGRLVPYKGTDMLLEAAAPLVKRGLVRLEIIGDGPELPALRGLVEREGLGAGITFSGWLKHRALQDRLIRSDIFAFPSVREYGGAVVLEAMASGLVPIVLNYGGPGEFVSPSTGFALPMAPRPRVVRSLTEAFERLAADPSVIRPMGARARERVLRSFTWSAKANQMLEVYRWALGQRLDKPDFGMPLPDAAGTEAGEPARTAVGVGG